MIKTRIALIGFMGVGKTLVSNDLEKTIGFEAVSTDQIIVDREKRVLRIHLK